MTAVQKKDRLEGVGGEVHAWPELGAGDSMVSKIRHGSSLMKPADGWKDRGSSNSHRNDGMLPTEKMF